MPIRFQVASVFRWPYWEDAMWHIVFIGYIFVTLMFALAQPSLARMLIYLVVWTILPTLFAFWVVYIRLRNKRLKQEEKQGGETLPK